MTQISRRTSDIRGHLIVPLLLLEILLALMAAMGSVGCGVTTRLVGTRLPSSSKLYLVVLFFAFGVPLAFLMDGGRVRWPCDPRLMRRNKSRMKVSKDRVRFAARIPKHAKLLSWARF